MDKPLVTIAVPLYKRRDYVGRTLLSVAAQDYGALDVLVSDNGENSDELRSWVGGFLGDRPFRFRRNDTSVPLTRHFNQLVEAANGEFFVLLSDDDEISSNYVSSLVGAINKNPDVAVGIARVELIDENGELHPRRDAAFPGGVLPYEDFIRIWCQHEYDFGSFVTNMARTSEILAAGAYPDFVKGNSIDNALLITLVAGRRVALVEEAVFRYRIYEASTGLAADYKELGRAQRQFLRYLDEHPLLKSLQSQNSRSWRESKSRLTEMAWRTYRHRWKNMYRARLSRPEWARAAFQMPFIPAYYREVVPYLLKTLIRGR